MSLRAKIDRIQLWTREKENVEAINALGKKLIKLLDLQDEPTVGLEFQVGMKDLTLRVSIDLFPSTIPRISLLPPSSCLYKLSILSMEEDSSGAHTLLALQISHLQAPHTQRLLSIAQVRLVLTSLIFYGSWDMH